MPETLEHWTFCMVNRLFSIGFLVFIGLSSAAFYLLALITFLITAPFDRRLVCLHQYSSLWAVFYLWCVPSLSFRVEGREKLDWKRQYMFVSNHQSMMDILVAFALFFPFKWVSKEEVFRLPFIGWNMKLNRYIGLQRGDKESVKKMMRECEKALDNGCSLFFFPEGTRSATGQLKPFKPGAFILARKKKVPVIPIVIHGTRDALPKKSLLLNHKTCITLKVLEEIPVERLSGMAPEAIADMARKTIDAAFQEVNTNRQISAEQNRAGETA